jgi:hypothetical protein
MSLIYYFICRMLRPLFRSLKAPLPDKKKEDYNERLLAAEIEKGSTLKDLVSAQQERTLVFGRLAAAVEHLAQQAPKK